MQLFIILLCSYLFGGVLSIDDDDNVLVFTVATDQTDGYQRYIQTATEYGIKPIVLGMGEKWQGGENILQNPGGGWKINLLKEALKSLEVANDKIVLFTDAYDVIFLSSLEKIVDKFKNTKARILFGAEGACWPDESLKSQYPEVEDGKRFLNSGIYIGYMPEILELLNKNAISDTDDDQLYFTKAYLDKDFREKNSFKLDHKSEIFQNLFGARAEIEIRKVEGKEGPESYKLVNTLFQTEPLIVHGNGFSKILLNSLSNYLANAWNSVEGCKHCKVNQFNLEGKSDAEMPLVLVSLFIEYATPFLEEQLQKIASLEYPKSRIHLFIHNAAKYHKSHVANFIENHGKKYRSVKQVTPEDETSEWRARDLSLGLIRSKKCEYYFSVDSVAHLDNPHTLRLLIEQNQTVVAPILVRIGKAWSNFWGDLTKDGYYARSPDYMDIVHNEKRGLWNVPFITNCYLVNAKLFEIYDKNQISFVHGDYDPDMSFCINLRNLNVFMFVSNRVDFGHLVNPETYDITRTEPDMYQIFENEVDWEERYIHEDYPESFNPDKNNEQPCPDVYWFPIVSRKFCSGLINMMEGYGQWSDGSNQDKRLEGGYEAVPTRDIHMNQVGWERHWLYFLQRYVRPLQEHVFIGYFHDPPKSLMNFVVRYRPDEQPSLRPHHDSSTYTINIALNEVGKDYEGGGCRFIRYNCSVTQTKIGWMMMHPGRLTHYHEGLLVTKGTRYIMIAFVDP